MNDGEVKMERLQLLSPYHIASLTDCYADECEVPHFISSVTIKSSTFLDVRVGITDGGLISGNGIQSEMVIECSFRNVSENNRSGEENRNRNGRIRKNMEESIIVSSEIIVSVSGIYGEIVSGIDKR